MDEILFDEYINRLDRLSKEKAGTVAGDGAASAAPSAQEDASADDYAVIRDDLTMHRGEMREHPLIRRLIREPGSGTAGGGAQPFSAEAHLRGGAGQSSYNPYGEAEDGGHSHGRSGLSGGGNSASIAGLHNVIDADASQVSAIRMTNTGKSFVLQGPPGTGKSQTITNIIAECMYSGKSVLFVSEKPAALNVVYHKLQMVGLSDFCLRIDHTRTDTKELLSDILHTLQLPSSPVKSNADMETNRRDAAAKSLDAYQKLLHDRQPVIGASLYQLYETFAPLRSAPEVSCSIDDIAKRDEGALAETVSLLDEYADSVPKVGYDYRLNPWYGFAPAEVSQQTRHRIRDHFTAWIRRIDQLIAFSGQISSLLEINCATLEDLDHIEEMVRFLSSDTLISAAFLNPQEYAEITGVFQQMEPLSAQLVKDGTVLEQYDDSVLELPAREYLRTLLAHASGISRVFDSESRRILGEIRLSRTDGTKVEYDDAVAFLRSLADYQDKEKIFQDLESRIAGKVGPLYEGIYTDWEKVREELAAFEAIPKELFGNLRSNATPARFDAVRRLCGLWMERFRANAETEDNNTAFLSQCFSQKVLDPRKVPMRRLRERIQSCLENPEGLDAWLGFREVLDKLTKRGDLDFVDACIDQLVPAEKMADAYRRLFYQEWISCIVRRSPTLSRFSRANHDRTVSVFRVKDRVEFEISRQQITAALASRRPGSARLNPGSRVAKLLNEQNMNSSLRELLNNNADLIQRIMPCFMMSPSDVCRFTDAERMSFDLVIFDEASQIPVPEALPAILRGNQLLIIGDSQQMPPYPGKLDADEIREEDEETGGAGGDRKEEREMPLSILDLASRRFGQFRLRWHYRSRKEGLIAFSNRHFYNNSLITFPSPTQLAGGSDSGVEYQYVESAWDDAVHTNRKSAAAVVDAIYDCIRQYPKQSLGIVAFTQEQENLIRFLVSKRRKTDPSGEEYFNGNPIEPFFIKNMETVQGDERDIIILDITYGRNRLHQLPADYGLISSPGGSQRLNVAITRAKRKMIVISGLHGYEIVEKPAGSTPGEVSGEELLASYLTYAETGPVSLGGSRTVPAYNSYERNMEQEVVDFLRKSGYDADQNVGFSPLKIDIAVRRPGADRYIAAVEFDGDSYHQAGNARDRDRLRQEILENAGWKYWRIWSAAWYEDPENEKRLLLRFLRGAGSS